MASRSSSSKPAHRVGGRIWTEHLSDGSAVDRGGAWLAPRHHAMFELARAFGVSTYKTWVDGAHLLVDEGRMLRYRGLIPKISPLAVATIALAQARLDWASKRVPLDAPWTARRAQAWDSRSVASWLERSGISTTVARDLFDMALRGLFTGSLDDTSYLHLLFLIRAHRSISRLFSIKGGAQENLMEGGAGLIATRMAESLGDGVRLAQPVRSITQHKDHLDVATDDVTVSARHAVVSVPPALALEIAFDPILPPDRRALYAGATAGPESKTLVVYDEPFWRTEGFSGQSADPGSAAEVTIDASPASGRPGVIASFTFGHVAERVAKLDDASRRRAVLDALTARFGPRAAAPVGVPRDGVVDRALDTRLLHGALPSGAPHRPRTPVARSPSGKSTGPAPRPRPGLTAPSTVRSCQASAPRPRSSTAPEAGAAHPGPARRDRATRTFVSARPASTSW